MSIKTLLVAASVFALSASPALAQSAQVERASAPATVANEIGGSSSLLLILAVVLFGAGIFFLVDNDDDDPDSP